jgi:glutamate--cysteine ligase
VSFAESILLKKYNPQILDKLIAALRDLVPNCGMPLYTSIDLRDSGSRLVAVDVNLFPAGFNNLSAAAIEKGVSEFRSFLETKLPEKSSWKLGLVPESHTNNEGYLYHLLTLKALLEKAGAELRLAWSGMPIPKPWELKFNQNSLLYHPLSSVADWSDAMILNHDLSGGPLEALKDYQKPIFPNPELGWYKRKKSEHFDIALKVLKNISAKVPQLDIHDFIADSKAVSNLDFSKKQDVERLMAEASDFLEKIKQIKSISEKTEKPFVYIKNDSGTYGLGIWSFSTLDELKDATKALQKTFARGKQGTQVRRVILQEGISTRLIVSEGDHVEFEPVVYSVNGNKIGSFFRYSYSAKGALGESNLNRPGSWFEESSRYPNDHHQMRGLYTFVALLHSVSAALEDCPCGEFI